MSDSNRTELNPNENFDAQRLSEDIESGEVNPPEPNFEKDYQKAQEFAVSSESVSENKDDDPLATGNPKNFAEMAKKVNITRDESV
ncbi:hypothetical protein [Merismopedia glauca]|uniref:Uncharacterized protein n=1 Tax=Merismopedia glauca CCAP 1448/3 TaxID=1296344 RepID=A0A2T1C6F8_9CYAN|nr:hypothetical protein [Merismopedia glauca]PSB03862.1 hypothetical protein C7B64_06515 [Merismopedia glauca CCAP 1448/3]